MRDNRFIFCLFLILLSCTKEDPPNYAIIKGTIFNNTSQKMYLNKPFRPFKIEMDISPKGKFADTLIIEEGMYSLYNDHDNSFAVYLEKGYNLHIEFDETDYRNTLTFSGKGSAPNIYIQKKIKKNVPLFRLGKDLYKMDESSFKSKVIEVQKSIEKILDSIEGISDSFKIKERRNLDYAYLKKLSLYEQNHSIIINNPNYKAPEVFLGPLDTLTYDNEKDYFYSTDYKDMVESYYRTKSLEYAKLNSKQKDIAYLETVATINNEKIKNDLLYEAIKYNIDYTESLEKYFNIYMLATTNKDHKKEITESYHKIKSLSKRKPSPLFNDFRNHKGGTVSLSDFKGKYVYIDVWATWCGPCIAEVPFLKEIEESYKDKNIEFISISIDKAKDHNKWFEMVNEINLGGMQILADKDWDTQFIKDYSIKSIPRFILIDPNGNIIDANASKPSSEDIRKLLNELLN